MKDSAAIPRNRRSRVLGLLVSVGLLTWLALAANWSTVGEILGRLGWTTPILLLPFLAAMTAGTGAWQLVLAQLGYLTPMWPMLRLRMGSESVLLSLPGGAVISEALKPLWLRDKMGLPIAESIASVAVVKACLAEAQGIYLIVAAAAAVAVPLPGSAATLSAMTTAGLAVGTGIGLVLFARVSYHLLSGGGSSSGAAAVLARLPIPPLRAWLAARQAEIASLDATFSRFFAPGGGLTRGLTLGICLAHWFTDALETMVIIWLLDLPISFGQALVMDAMASLVRAAAFMLPAGLGAQDVGIAAFMRAFGVPDPDSAAAAFCVTKRAKEVFWIAVGYVLVAGVRRTRPSAATG